MSVVVATVLYHRFTACYSFSVLLRALVVATLQHDTIAELHECALNNGSRRESVNILEQLTETIHLWNVNKTYLLEAPGLGH